MGNWKLVLLVAALCGAFACSNANEMDAGTDAGTQDTGSQQDSATHPDSATQDSATHPDGGTTGDSSTCPPAMVQAPTTAVCAHATLTCLMAAGANASAQQTCIMNDPMATACGDCINQDFLAQCTMTGGCDQEWGNVECCVSAHCSASDMNCQQMAVGTGGACATQVMAFDSCSMSNAHCGGVTMTCFM